MQVPINKPINQQIDFFLSIIQKNEQVHTVIETAQDLNLSNWYVGAGCLVQTVWNALSDRPLSENIKDIDLIYFDSSDLSEEAEETMAQKVREKYSNVPLELDVRNQARVHLWYKESFGYSIKPYQSTEEGINSWPTTTTSVGVRFETSQYEVYAPYGLNDLLSLVVRPNKSQITEAIYDKKVARWHQCWPHLTVVGWNDQKDFRRFQ